MELDHHKVPVYYIKNTQYPFHTGISVDLREVAKARGARIIEIQEDAAHNVRKVLEELLNND